MNTQRKKLLITLGFGVSVGFIIGYLIGVATVIDVVYKVANQFIEIDKVAVRDALTKYAYYGK